jgi:hypothetical protein
VKLELLPADPPYSRPSNAQGPITVSNLQLRLPVLEQPGSLGGLVQAPGAGVTSPGSSSGATPARRGTTAKPGVASLARRLLAGRKAISLRLACAGSGACGGQLSLAVGSRSLARGSYSIPIAQTARLKLRLTKAGRKLVRKHRRAGHKSFRIKVELDDAGRQAPLALGRRVRLRRAS